MSEPVTPETPVEGKEPEDQRVPYERFEQVNRKAKEAGERATALEQQIADLRTQLEDREAAGLPEMDQLKKRLEQAEKRAQDAETAAERHQQQVKLTRAERLVIAAAKDFQDPDDATRFLDLADIEDSDHAERAVKKLAKSKPHLLKREEAPLPGKVLNNGKQVQREHGDPLRSADEEAAAGLLDAINKARSQSGYRAS